MPIKSRSIMALTTIDAPVGEKPRRRWLRFGLSTLLVAVALFALLFASLRPSPRKVFVSHHNIKFTGAELQQQTAAAEKLKALIDARMIVGTKAEQHSLELAYATRIDIQSDRIEYHLAIGDPEEYANVVIIIVDPQTGIIREAIVSEYMW